MDYTSLPHFHGEKDDMAVMQQHIDRIDNFHTVAEIFAQLGDTTRIRLFWLLCHCEECVINISAMLKMSSPAVSHHLRALKSSGLITSRREGKEVYYRAADTVESQLLHKMIEQVMEIACPERETDKEQHPICQSELESIVREIHDRLTDRMDERITIDELARQYLINPTTLKTAFKNIYGRSIATHIREHRMEKAAKLLKESDLSICEIAGMVGYDSQSKFSVAFKGYYGVLPKEYRK